MKLPAALHWLLWPASLVYEAAALLRASCYRRGVFRQQRLGGVVISVGNLTVGGTGKTPMVLWIVQRLIDEGKRVGILTRGYRSRGQFDEHGFPVSDEVALLRGRLGKRAHFGIGADRHARGRMLERGGVDWFVLDDGFQHLRLARDVDIVLLDATDPFGGGHLLPTGRLREPRSALARADLVVITRSEHAPAVESIVQHHSRATIFYAQMEFGDIFPLQEPRAAVGSRVRAQRIFAFCAIGNPAAFSDDLKRWALRVVGFRAYPDHHVYSQRDAEELERRAQEAGAEALLCTEKDIFNLRGVQFRRLPAYYCRASLNVSRAQAFWTEILRTAAHNRARSAP